MNNIEKLICLLLIFLMIKNKINLDILAIIYFVIIVDIILEKNKKCNEPFASNHIDYTPLKKKLLEHDLISLTCKNCNKSLDDTKYILTFSQIGNEKMPVLQEEEYVINDITNYENILKNNIEKCNLEESLKNYQENLIENEEEKKVLIKNYNKCEYITRHKSYFKLLNKKQNIFTLYGSTEGDKIHNNITLSEFLGITEVTDDNVDTLKPEIKTRHDEYVNSNLYLEIISHYDDKPINIDGTIGKQIEKKNNKLKFIDNNNFEIILFFVVNDNKKYVTWKDIQIDNNNHKILSLSDSKENSLVFNISFI